MIELFTDPGDIVIDPVAGSGSTLRAAKELGRSAYGFEVSRDAYNKAMEYTLNFGDEETDEPESECLFDTEVCEEMDEIR